MNFELGIRNFELRILNENLAYVKKNSTFKDTDIAFGQSHLESTFLSHVNVRTIITLNAAHTPVALGGYVLFSARPFPERVGSLRKKVEVVAK